MTVDEARPHIEAALQYGGGTHLFEDIAQLITEQRLQFWPGINSVIITEIITYPRKKTLNFFLAGGNLAELEVMYPLVEEWGKTQGCTDASTTCRPGWQRTFLKREGWTSQLVVLSKEF